MRTIAHVSDCKTTSRSYIRLAKLALANKWLPTQRRAYKRLLANVGLCPACQTEYRKVYLDALQAKRAEQAERQEAASILLHLA